MISNKKNKHMKTKVLLLMIGLVLGSAFGMEATAQHRFYGGGYRHWGGGYRVAAFGGGYYRPVVAFRPRVVVAPAPVYYAPYRHRHFWVEGYWGVDAWGRQFWVPGHWA